MDREYLADTHALLQERPALAVELAKVDTLEHVFRWLRAPGAPVIGAIETIALDEFSHIMILELSELSEFLVFAAT